MKQLLQLITFCLIFTNAFAKKIDLDEQLLAKINQQVITTNKILKQYGSENISDVYFQRLDENTNILKNLLKKHNNDQLKTQQITSLLHSLNSIFNTNKKSTFKPLGTGNGTIQGRILSQVTGNIIQGSVYIYNSIGTLFGLSYTDRVGRYIFKGFPSGQYVLVTLNSTNYVDTAYPNTACPNGLGIGCQLSDLTFITLAEDEVIQGVDILVSEKPTISGVISDQDNNLIKINSALITALNMSGEELTRTHTNDLGEYSIILPGPGDYFITASHSIYQKELYNNVTCNLDCDFNLGTVIHIENNEGIENLNIDLKKYASINGLLLDSETSESLDQSSVTILNENNEYVFDVFEPASGQWQVFLAPGNYYAIATNDGFLAQKYNNFDCITYESYRCDSQSGTLITHGQVETNNIDFQLNKGTTISGKITNSLNEPLADILLELYSAIDETQYVVQYGRSLENGDFIFPNLGNGDFYIVANSGFNSSYETEIYNDIYCTDTYSCDFNLATPITIEQGIAVDDINIQLNNKSKIFGQVIDNNNNNFVRVGVVALRNIETNSRIFSTSLFDSNGNYEINDIPHGRYQLYISGNNTYLPQSHEGYSCEHSSCINANFTPIVIDDTQSININFQLAKKGIVNFDLRTVTNTPLRFGFIDIYKPNGSKIDTISYDNTQTVSLANGDYYFYFHGRGSANRVYGGVNCENNCDFTAGKVVHVSENSLQTVTMIIDKSFVLDITVAETDSYLTLYNEDLTEINQYYIQQFRPISIEMESKFYMKFSKDGYFSQLYNGVECIDENCDISQGQLMTPQVNSRLTLDIDFRPVNSISGRITDKNNNPIANETVSISESVRIHNIAISTMTNANGEYEIIGVSPREYYLYFNSQTGSQYAKTYYGNIACDELDCSNQGINLIAINAGDYLTDYDIQVTQRGNVSGQGIVNFLNEADDFYLTIYKVIDGEPSLSRLRQLYINNGILPPHYLKSGEYKLFAHPINQNLSSAYPDVDCKNLSLQSCALNAESIFIENDTDFVFNSFLVHKYGVIKGLISDKNTNLPIGNLTVNTYYQNQGTRIYESTTTNYIGQGNDGQYELALKDEGQFRLYMQTETGSPYNKYIPQLYNNIDCLAGLGIDCLLSQGETIDVTHDSITTIDIMLNSKPKIKINFIDSITEKNIASFGGLSVYIYDENFDLVLINEFSYSPDGFHIESLNPGNYYAIVKTESFSPYRTTGYPDINCQDASQPSTCDGTLQSFSINLGDSLQEITVKSPLLKGISGYVKDAQTGLPLNDIIIDTWNEDGFILNQPVLTNENGAFSIPFINTSLGNFYFSTDTNNDYINEVYQDIDCQTPAILGNCDVTQGQLINIPENNQTPIIIDIELNKTTQKVITKTVEK